MSPSLHVRFLTTLALLLPCALTPAQTPPASQTRNTGGRLFLVLPFDSSSHATSL